MHPLSVALTSNLLFIIFPNLIPILALLTSLPPNEFFVISKAHFTLVLDIQLETSNLKISKFTVMLIGETILMTEDPFLDMYPYFQGEP